MSPCNSAWSACVRIVSSCLLLQLQWIESVPMVDPSKLKPQKSRKRTKVLQNNFGRKTSIKVALTSRLYHSNPTKPTHSRISLNS